MKLTKKLMYMRYYFEAINYFRTKGKSDQEFLILLDILGDVDIVYVAYCSMEFYLYAFLLILLLSLSHFSTVCICEIICRKL